MSRVVASVGLFAKTGRAIAIALAGPPESPRILNRYELALSSESHPATISPYHAVMELPWAKALVAAQPSVRAIEALATESLRRTLVDVSKVASRVSAVGIVGSIGQDPGRIGNPHIRAHAAEGQLFRHALEAAASACGLPYLSFSPKDVWQVSASRLQVSEADLQARVHALGKGIVKPWRTEERSAALAGWAALSAGPSRGLKPHRARTDP